MKFLLFNFAVVAALVYIFAADRNGLGLGGGQGEDPLQSLRQEVEALAQGLAEDRRKAAETAPEAEATERPKETAKAPPSKAAESLAEASNNPAEPADSAAPEPAPAKPLAELDRAKLDRAKLDRAEQDVAPAPVAKAPTAEPEPAAAPAAAQAASPAVAADSLPPVDDPAVARRRAEVLDGVALFDAAPRETAVKAGPPMSPDERLRKLYSLAEEMELLYVSKISR